MQMYEPPISTDVQLNIASSVDSFSALVAAPATNADIGRSNGTSSMVAPPQAKEAPDRQDSAICWTRVDMRKMGTPIVGCSPAIGVKIRSPKLAALIRLRTKIKPAVEMSKACV